MLSLDNSSCYCSIRLSILSLLKLCIHNLGSKYFIFYMPTFPCFICQSVTVALQCSCLCWTQANRCYYNYYLVIVSLKLNLDIHFYHLIKYFSLCILLIRCILFNKMNVYTYILFINIIYISLFVFEYIQIYHILLSCN